MPEPSIEPTPPANEPTDLPPPGQERRGRRGGRRGRVVLFWDLMYGGLRRRARHARSLYATVGIFLVAGTVLAIIGTLLFAALGEWVQQGGTQTFDVAVLH